MAGLREMPTWQTKTPGPRDFFDLKGVLEALLKGLHIPEVSFRVAEYPTFTQANALRSFLASEVLEFWGITPCRSGAL